jgi:hypothetical protein
MNEKEIHKLASSLADRFFNDFGRGVLNVNRDWAPEYEDSRFTHSSEVAQMETLALKLFSEKLKTIYPVQITFDV